MHIHYVSTSSLGLSKNDDNIVAEMCLSSVHYITGFLNMTDLKADDFSFHKLCCAILFSSS